MIAKLHLGSNMTRYFVNSIKVIAGCELPTSLLKLYHQKNFNCRNIKCMHFLFSVHGYMCDTFLLD